MNRAKPAPENDASLTPKNGALFTPENGASLTPKKGILSGNLQQSPGILYRTPEVYGKSVWGLPLEFFPADPSTETAPGNFGRILLLAGIHGEEPEGTILLSRALRTIQELHTDVILCANPDGITRGTRGNAHGVDLNRNFPASNWSAETVYTRWTLEEERNTPFSPGEHPGSEPETQALIQLIQNRNIRRIVSLHSPLGLLDLDPPENANSAGCQSWRVQTARAIAERCQLPLSNGPGYPTPGSMGSWVWENSLEMITFELPRLSVEELSQRFLNVLQDILTKNS